MESNTTTTKTEQIFRGTQNNCIVRFMLEAVIIPPKHPFSSFDIFFSNSALRRAMKSQMQCYGKESTVCFHSKALRLARTTTNGSSARYPHSHISRASIGIRHTTGVHTFDSFHSRTWTLPIYRCHWMKFKLSAVVHMMTNYKKKICVAQVEYDRLQLHWLRDFSHSLIWCELTISVIELVYGNIVDINALRGKCIFLQTKILVPPHI